MQLKQENQKTKVVSISQPTFLPWIGYFDLIDRSDYFVFFDDAQFSKHSWHQRNKIINDAWITLPISSGNSHKLLCEINLGKDKRAFDRLFNKIDAVVMFGDESVAPWHRKTHYGKAMIFNNSLWSADVPINSIPNNIKDFSLKYVLGDCFYMVKLRTRKEKDELADLTIPHIGHRGGNILSRYFGKLEGINPSVKQALDTYTVRNNLQLSSVIEDAILKYINEKSK